MLIAQKLLLEIISYEKYKLYSTVGTPNKGQLIFWKNGSNKGILAIPLFTIFTKWRQIREFYGFQPYEKALFDYESP